jgi:hypothetical protein
MRACTCPTTAQSSPAQWAAAKKLLALGCIHLATARTLPPPAEPVHAEGGSAPAKHTHITAWLHVPASALVRCCVFEDVQNSFREPVLSAPAQLHTFCGMFIN